MAIEAVKIPQNVYVEDRIIGPVTLKQLAICGIGAGISYTVYAFVSRAGYTQIPVIVVCWTPALIAAMFAFMKINDLSLFNIILLFIESMNKPNQRYWSPHPGISINLITRQTMKEVDAAQAKAQETVSKLAEMTRQLEKRQEEMYALTTSDRNPDMRSTETLSKTDGNEPDSGPAIVMIHDAETAERHEVSALPVRRDKVRLQGLETSRCIDGVMQDLMPQERYSPSYGVAL